MRDTSHLEFDCSWTWKQQDGTLETTLSYIGFIYTFYLQIFFVSKSSLYTILNSRTATPVRHPHALVLLEAKRQKGEDFICTLQFGIFINVFWRRGRNQKKKKRDMKAAEDVTLGHPPEDAKRMFCVCVCVCVCVRGLRAPARYHLGLHHHGDCVCVCVCTGSGLQSG